MSSNEDLSGAGRKRIRDDDDNGRKESKPRTDNGTFFYFPTMAPVHGFEYIRKTKDKNDKEQAIAVSPPQQAIAFIQPSQLQGFSFNPVMTPTNNPQILLAQPGLGRATGSSGDGSMQIPIVAPPGFMGLGGAGGNLQGGGNLQSSIPMQQIGGMTVLAAPTPSPALPQMVQQQPPQASASDSQPEASNQEASGQQQEQQPEQEPVEQIQEVSGSAPQHPSTASLQLQLLGQLQQQQNPQLAAIQQPLGLQIQQLQQNPGLQLLQQNPGLQQLQPAAGLPQLQFQTALQQPASIQQLQAAALLQPAAFPLQQALQGLQPDGSLIQNLLMAQMQGSLLSGAGLAAGVVGQPQQLQLQQQPAAPCGGPRPDPPTGMSAALTAMQQGQASMSAQRQQMSFNTVHRSLATAPASQPSALARRPAAQPRRAPPKSHHVDNSGTKSVLLYVASDDDCISPYQCFARQQIELFEAQEVDVQTGAQGRNKPVRLGQVGIRCIHCADLHPKLRTRAAVYYPSRLTVLYQAAQNIVNIHLPELCESIPEDIRTKLIGLDNKRSSVGGGKNYWSDTAQIQGIVDTGNGLRFKDSIGEGDGNAKLDAP